MDSEEAGSGSETDAGESGSEEAGAEEMGLDNGEAGAEETASGEMGAKWEEVSRQWKVRLWRRSEPVREESGVGAGKARQAAGVAERLMKSWREPDEKVVLG